MLLLSSLVRVWTSQLVGKTHLPLHSIRFDSRDAEQNAQRHRFINHENRFQFICNEYNCINNIFDSS